MPIDFRRDADVCRRAMKGFGCDDDILIHTICDKTTEEIQVLRRVYAEQQKRDLLADIKSETSWWYKEAMIATVLTPEEYTCRVLHKAMSGMGTDESAMIQALSHLKGPEMELVKATYLKKYNKNLSHDIQGDTSGSLKKFFIGLINSKRDRVADPNAEIERDIVELYNAGENRWGHDSDVFINIITKHNNEYLRALNVAYGRKYGDSLVRCIHKQFGNSSYLGEGMQAMLLDHDAYYASLIFKAVDGIGTDDALLVRVLGCRKHRMYSIALRFMLLYGKNLNHRVQQDTSGNYKEVLSRLISVSERTSKDTLHTSPATAAAACGRPPPMQADAVPAGYPAAGPPPAVPGSAYPLPISGHPPPTAAPSGHAPPPGYPPLFGSMPSAHHPSFHHYPDPYATGPGYPAPTGPAPPLGFPSPSFHHPSPSPYPPPASSAPYPSSAPFAPPASSAPYPSSTPYPSPYGGFPPSSGREAPPPPPPAVTPPGYPSAHPPPYGSQPLMHAPSPYGAAPPSLPLFGGMPPGYGQPPGGGNVAELTRNLESMGFKRPDIDEAIHKMGAHNVDQQPLTNAMQGVIEAITNKQEAQSKAETAQRYPSMAGASPYPGFPPPGGGAAPPPPPPFF